MMILRVWNFLILSVVTAVLLSSCRPPLTFEEYDNPLQSHALSAINEFDGYLWAAGGYSFEYPHGRKVWKSRDGVDWTEVATLPEERVASNMEIHNGFMWLTGGFELYDIEFASEIFRSKNGTDWEPIALPAGSAEVTNSFVFNDQLYIILFYSAPRELRLYRTTDGRDWERIGTTFPIRNLNKIVLLNETLYAFANGSLNRDGTVAREIQIWTSDNAITWRPETLPEVFLSPRAHFSVATYRRKIWLVGGSDGWFERYNDIWSFNELEGWRSYVPPASPPFEVLHGHTAISFREKLWLFQGTGEEGLPTNKNYNLEN